LIFIIIFKINKKIIEFFIIFKKKTNKKLLFQFYKIDIIIIFKVLFEIFYKEKIDNLNNRNILIYKKYNLKKYNYFNIYRSKIINKIKNKVINILFEKSKLIIMV